MESVINRSYIWVLLIVLIGCKKKNGSDSHSSLYTFDSNEIVVPKDSTILMQKIGLVYYKEAPFTGTTTEYSSNNILVESITYVSGKKEGFFKKWFRDGTISFESRYVDGKRNGKTRSWWNNGKLRSESNFEKGILQGLQKSWYKSGAKFKEMSIVDGQEHGMQKSWRENGKIYNNYEAKDGRIYGLKKATLCFQLDDEQLKPGK